MRREGFQKIEEALFPAGQARHADQAALVGGEAQHQRVARPRLHMGAECCQRRHGLAGKQVTKDIYVALLARRGAVTVGHRGGQGLAHRSNVARELEGAGLADMGQSEGRIGGDGAVEGRGGAGVDGKQKVDALDVGIARGGDGGGEGEAIAVRQHVTFILMAIAGNFDSSVTAEGSLAALGMPLFIELAHGASLDKAVISRSAR